MDTHLSRAASRRVRRFLAAKNELVFEHGEVSKVIAIPIINDLEAEKDESFAVELYDPRGGAQLGKHTKTVVTIINDDGKSSLDRLFRLISSSRVEYKTITNKMASLVQVDMDKLSVTKTSWGQQFQDAMNVNGGDLATAKFSNYFGHALSFFWKVICLWFAVVAFGSAGLFYSRCSSLLSHRQPSLVVGWRFSSRFSSLPFLPPSSVMWPLFSAVSLAWRIASPLSRLSPLVHPYLIHSHQCSPRRTARRLMMPSEMWWVRIVLTYFWAWDFPGWLLLSTGNPR